MTLSDPPVAERADYYDLGLEQKLGSSLVLGVDSYYRKSSNLIDEGQFGAPIILTPFNYRDGIIKGIEFTANYSNANGLTAYANLAFQSAQGRAIETAQFNFAQDDLDYIASHYIHLDHEQQFTASGGALLCLGPQSRWCKSAVGYGITRRPDAARRQHHPERRTSAELHADQPGCQPGDPSGRAPGH